MYKPVNRWILGVLATLAAALFLLPNLQKPTKADTVVSHYHLLQGTYHVQQTDVTTVFRIDDQTGDTWYIAPVTAGGKTGLQWFQVHP